MTTSEDIIRDWDAALQPVVCDHCDWYFLAEADSPSLCPHCFQGTLQAFDGDLENLPAIAPPEMLIDFQLAPSQLAPAFNRFRGTIPFPGSDSRPDNLTARARAVYLPMWLADASVNARWSGQAGYPYEVESHKSAYQRGQWHTHKVYETRLDWEERVGALQRSYKNVTAPALEEHPQLVRYLGDYEPKNAIPYRTSALAGALVRLPNRDSSDAFTEAQDGFRQRAGQDVQQAVDAAALRNFRWQADYDDLNWTLLLLPVYLSYYEDDAGTRRRVLINGYSGSVSGERRGSMKRAQRITGIGLTFAAALIALAIVLALLDAPEETAVLVAVAGAVLGLAAFVPVLMVWRFNDQVADVPI